VRPALLALWAVPLAAGCGERTARERCEDVEARLTHEAEELPTGCRRDTDCRPAQLACGRLRFTSAQEIPPEVTRLAERHEQLGCCLPPFDDTVPLDLPGTSCEVDEEGEGRCRLDCDDVAERVASRQADLPVDCTQATQCRPVRLPCGRYGITSSRESLQALDSLVQWHDDYGCCDAAFDPAAIPAPPGTLYCNDQQCSLTP